MPWQNNKKITGLWAYGPQNQNVWIHVQGIGWRRIWNDHDSQVAVMTAMAAHAKAENRNVNFEEENGKIKQMYVW